MTYRLDREKKKVIEDEDEQDRRQKG